MVLQPVLFDCGAGVSVLAHAFSLFSCNLAVSGEPKISGSQQVVKHVCVLDQSVE
jgi:hypothetical protein